MGYYVLVKNDALEIYSLPWEKDNYWKLLSKTHYSICSLVLFSKEKNVCVYTSYLYIYYVYISMASSTETCMPL